MGQRTAPAASRRELQNSAAKARAASTARLQVSVFATDLGWMGILGNDGRLTQLVLGHASASAVRDDVRHRLAEDSSSDGDSLIDPEECDWNPELRRQLERFAAGERVDFYGCTLELPTMTAFQRRIVERTRKIPYGGTLSYSELAAKAGSPGAARAVGNVMRANHIPLIIPCHRVVAASGLGGYSAPQGLDLKRRLLAMEAGER